METTRTIRDAEPRTATSTLTQFLSSGRDHSTFTQFLSSGRDHSPLKADGCRSLRARLCVRSESSPVQFCAVFRKVPGMRPQTKVPRVCVCMQNGHVRTLRILWSMLGFGRVWKHRNNPARNESVRVCKLLNLDTMKKKKKK